MTRRMLERIAIALIIAGLVVASIGLVGVYLLTFPGIQLERVGFTTEGYDSPARRVSGLLLVPDEPVSRPTPAVIFSHSMPGVKEQYLGICRELALRGLIVLDIDLRGHGSTGGNSDFGYSEMRDIWAAADYLASRGDVDGDRIAAIGYSYGGTASVRAGIFQDDHKVDAVAAVYCWPGEDDAAPLVWGSIEDYMERLWPHLALSRRFDISSPEERRKRQVRGHLTRDRPPNLLLVIGSRDELATVEDEREIMREATGQADLSPGQTYGDFAEGTARKFVVTNDNHVSEMISLAVWDSVFSWVFEAFGLEKPAPPGNGHILRLLFQGLVLVGLLVVAAGFIYYLRFKLDKIGPPWSPGIPISESTGYRWLSLVAVLAYLAVSYATLPLTGALGMRAFVPLSTEPLVLGADLLACIAAGHILTVAALFALLAAAGWYLKLEPFHRWLRSPRVSLHHPGNNGSWMAWGETEGSAYSCVRVGNWGRLVIGVAPFALFLLLYAPAAHGLFLMRGVPVSVTGFLTLSVVFTLFLYLEGHFFHTFLLSCWKALDRRRSRYTYIISEALIRGLALGIAFIPVSSNPLVPIGGPPTRIPLPLVPTMMVAGFFIFLPIAALTLTARRRGYGVFAASVCIALFVSWVYASLVGVRFF